MWSNKIRTMKRLLQRKLELIITMGTRFVSIILLQSNNRMRGIYNKINENTITVFKREEVSKNGNK